MAEIIFQLMSSCEWDVYISFASILKHFAISTSHCEFVHNLQDKTTILFLNFIFFMFVTVKDTSYLRCFCSATYQSSNMSKLIII